jgi:surface antigen
MNPALLLTISGSVNRKYIGVVLVSLFIIVMLPFMAVFALGTNTLSFLVSTLEGSDSTSYISSTSQGLYEGSTISSDTYAWGNCTWWVYALRLQAGDSIPTTWGNAATWAFYAGIDGYVVNHTPSVGSIMQISTVDNGLGHVAYVTNVDPATGDWTISEMNVEGLDIVDLKTYPPSAAAGFDFIHDKATP